MPHSFGRTSYWSVMALLVGAGVLLVMFADRFSWHTPTAGYASLLAALVLTLVALIHRPRPWFAATVACIVGLLAVALWFGNRTRADYLAGARGIVVNVDGSPLPGATVAIAFERAVFKAIEPVSSASAVTDAAGEFNLTYIAHASDQPYKLFVSNPGYRSVAVSGSGHGEHRIALSRPLNRP